MFYSHDLLRLNGGKFGVIWMLGNSPGARGSNRRSRADGSKVSKADIMRTDVRKICLEVAALLPTSHRQHISLRMAATLYMGTVDCHARQVGERQREMDRF